MHQLLRRVAMGLTLPLAVGAPALLLVAPAQAAMLEVNTFTSVESAVYGQQVVAFADVTDGGEPVIQGSVTFEVGRISEEPVMIVSGVPLDANGRATSPPLLQQETGRPLDVDDWQVTASYSPPEMSPVANDSSPFSVSTAQSTIAIMPTATSVTADLTGVVPGGTQENSLRPSGPVHFTLNGQDIGTAELDATGHATLAHAVPSGQAQALAASYAGDPRYGPSSVAASRHDPILEARVISDFGRSKSGWYRTAVQVWFVCKPQGSELVEDCPADVSLKKSGKNQSVTRTIHALDGGSATLTVAGIDIDRDKPVITVEGRTCSATDKLSGVKGRCHMRIAPNGTYRAVALDKAGNRAVKRGVLA